MPCKLRVCGLYVGSYVLDKDETKVLASRRYVVSSQLLFSCRHSVYAAKSSSSLLFMVFGEE